MNRALYLGIVGLVAGLFATPALAQMAPKSSVEVNGVIVEAHGASNADLHMALLKNWSDFESEHPDIAKDLARRPSRISDASYLQQHQALQEFVNNNPGTTQEFEDDPGNFVVVAENHASHSRKR